jgi:hypothetical protein
MMRKPRHDAKNAGSAFPKVMKRVSLGEFSGPSKVWTDRAVGRPTRANLPRFNGVVSIRSVPGHQ